MQRPHRALLRLFLTSLALLAALCGAPAFAQGTAVVIGGNLKTSHEAVWRRMVELAGGPGARFVVLGTASNNAVAAAEQAASQLRQYGATATVLPVGPQWPGRPIAEAVRDPALVAEVRAARGVFFTGGSQDRITAGLQPGGQRSPLLQAIWELFERGGVVAGTSAGAAIMSTTMFVDAPRPLEILKGRFKEGEEVGPGLGFVGPKLFVDQHFLARGRIGRLLPLMKARGYVQGLGVEEDSAAAVRGTQVEMLGGRALYVDLSQAKFDDSRGAFTMRGARLSLLDSGDRFDLATGQITPVKARREGQVLEVGTPGYKPYYTAQPFPVDMLAPGVMGTAMGHLIDGTYNEIVGLAFDPRAKDDDPLAALGFEFRLYKVPGSIAWYSEASGGEDYTVHRLALDVLPVRVARPLVTPWAPR